MLLSIILISLLWGDAICGDPLVINNANDLIDFSNSVNSGTNYKGETVLVGSDITFTEELSLQFKPIGNEWKTSFYGTFDGQGHTISNLTIADSSLHYLGLFGFSRGMLKNIVIDGTCHIKSSLISTERQIVYVGGLTGYSDNGVLIENIVNMASIAFTGNVNHSACLGGIAGTLYSDDENITIKNCANYGPITHSGTSVNSYMAGIVSEFWVDKTVIPFIQSCLNHGSISFNGKVSSWLYIGGIAGAIPSTTFENCMSVGKISSPEQDGYIGTIFSNVKEDMIVELTQCHWTNAVGYDKVCGRNRSYVGLTD